MKNMNDIKSKITQAIEHNPDHYIELNMNGKVIKPCARCFGKVIGMLFALPIALLFFLGFFHISFLLSFAVSWILAVPAITDWATIKIGIRRGNNKIRVLTGLFLGAGIVTYFLVMPATFLFKISTFLLYSSVFFIIRTHVNYGWKNFMKFIKEEINKNMDMLNKPNFYSCGVETGCCCSLCDGCFGTCLNAGVCVCLTILAIPFCCCVSKLLCGGRK